MSMTKEQYAEYLNSEEWWQRRTRVLERSNGLCEGCRNDEATDVHHLTYAHAGDEFLFELVALCAPCHERIHGGTGQSNKAQTRQGWQRRKTDGERWRERVKKVLR